MGGTGIGGRAVVNLLDLSDDDVWLFDAFSMLLPESQSMVLRQISTAACYAVLTRADPSAAKSGGKSPEEMTEAFLMRCMPSIPSGYVDDFGFEDAYHDHAVPLLKRRCVVIVLGASDLDARHAVSLVADLTECAMRIRSEFCAPDFEEDGFIDVDVVREFIEGWRDNFTINLDRAGRA